MRNCRHFGTGRGRAADRRGAEAAGISRLRLGGRRDAGGRPGDAAARRGQAEEPRSEAGARAAQRQDRHRPHPLGDAWQADRAERPPARERPPRGRAQRDHREFQVAARGTRRQGPSLRHRDRFGSRGVPRDRRDGGGQAAGRGGACGAEAHARRLRAGLSVRRRGGPSDRRATGRAARGRLWRGRGGGGDVSGLRRAGARPVHRPRRLSRGGRLGHGDARGREIPGHVGPAGQAARDPEPGGRIARRKGQLPPLHGQGDPRTARSRRPYDRPLRRHGRAAPEAFRLAGRRRRADARFDRRLRHRLHGRADRQILDRAPRPAARRGRRRLRISLPRAARGQGRLDDPDLAIGRDRRHARLDALCERAGVEDARRRQRADFQHRAARRRFGADARGPGDRRRLDEGVHLPARRDGVPGHEPRAREGRAERGEGKRTGRRTDRDAGPAWPRR